MTLAVPAGWLVARALKMPKEDLDALLRRFLEDGRGDRERERADRERATSSILEKIHALGERVDGNYLEIREDMRGIKARVALIEDQIGPHEPRPRIMPSIALASLAPPPGPLVVDAEDCPTGVHRKVEIKEIDRLTRAWDEAEVKRKAVIEYAAQQEADATKLRTRLTFWVTFLGGMIPLMAAAAWIVSRLLAK